MSPRGRLKKPYSSSSSGTSRAPGNSKADPVSARSVVSQRTPVVGIAASAGGVDALKAFFRAVPANSRLVFVVVHLDPTSESLVPELLAKSTRLRVEQARDRQPLEADHVYITPPNRKLTIDRGLLHVQEVADRGGPRGAIDHFFRSLAEDQRDRAVAIVLSGTGTEGALGARAVKAEGGIVMAQAPDTAAQADMPSSVIATGLVDMVLAPHKMPEALLKYVRSTRVHHVAPAAVEAKPSKALSAILAVLRAQRKYDFRGYDKETLEQRIERRMGLQHLESVTKYTDFLRAHPSEADQLFKDLLIRATSFFKDPRAFDELTNKVLAELVRKRDSDSPIRVWVPGCSTGEEAYSIAIALAEQAAAAQSRCRVQVLATDVDDHALELARRGTYPESIALDVTPRRLERFFTREDHRYTVIPSIHQSVTFAAQNLLSDPPFSKLDLVSCGNVLIYLEPDVQERLLSLFHFALKPGGYLFLKSMERVGPFGGLFAPIYKSRRIYRRLATVRRPTEDFPDPLPTPEWDDRVSAKAVPQATTSTLVDRQLLEHFAPVALVVKRTGEIVRSYGSTERYIRLPSDDGTLDALALARDTLKPALHAALHDAVRHNRRSVREAFEIKRKKGRATLRIIVQPIRGGRSVEDLWLIIFEELPLPSGEAAWWAAGQSPGLIGWLEAELRATKKDQQHLIEQIESSDKERNSTNEEILSMTEELQSANDELVMSKQELESMNVELATLNLQLQEKVHELTAVNDDLTNLLLSTDIATVFVDTHFRIKRFTTAATHLLNLLPSDVGRPINHLATNLVDVNLLADARTVLSNLAPIEKEVAAQDGKYYLVRVFPYRTEDDSVQGIVVTLVDVTTLKKTEHELRMAQAESRRLNQTLEQRVGERTKWLMLMHDVTRDINDAPSWDQALHLVLRRICESEHWQVGFVYLPDRDSPDTVGAVISCLAGERFRSFHVASEQRRYVRGQSLPGRVYKDGVPVWVNDQDQLLKLLPIRGTIAKEVGLNAAVALPIRFGRDVMAVLELFSDQPHEPNDLLENLMNDVSAQIGEVLERERATAQMADLAWREQQSLLHTLHDSLGQTLTGLGMLSSGLRQQLSNRAAADTARLAAEQAQLALEQVRQLSRGVFPVEIEPEDLLPAVRKLASTTEALHKVRVYVDGEVPRSIRDSRIATQLYRIAQEGVTNAVKHAHARTIRIEVSAGASLTKLRVIDDGIGIQQGTSKGDGLGWRIMRYRATSIGAALSIDPGSDGGTIVTCTLRQTPLSTESETANES